MVVCLYFILQFSNQTKHPSQIQRCDSYHLTVTLLHLHQPIQGVMLEKGKKYSNRKKSPALLHFVIHLKVILCGKIPPGYIRCV